MLNYQITMQVLEKSALKNNLHTMSTKNTSRFALGFTRLALGIFIAFFALSAPSHNVDAAVRVDGYVRKDGTYVAPHYRSNPDGNPYNNWSFPGNTNPYTGKVAPGNPDIPLPLRFAKPSLQ